MWPLVQAPRSAGCAASTGWRRNGVLALVLLALAGTAAAAASPDPPWDALDPFEAARSAAGTRDDRYNPRWAPAVRCSLELRGEGAALRHARLACTGGTITVGVRPELEPHAKAFSGVRLVRRDGPECRLWGRATPAGVADAAASGVFDSNGMVRSCLLTICGDSEAVFDRTNISDVAPRPGLAMASGIVCVVSSRTVAFRRPHVTGVRNSTLATFTLGPLASVVVEDGIFERNEASAVWAAYGRVLLARTVVREHRQVMAGVIWIYPNGVGDLYNCTFEHNRVGVAEHYDTASPREAPDMISVMGGSVVSVATMTGAFGRASLNATRCIFRHNQANQGGAVSISGNLSLPLLDACTFENNTASEGGAVFARGSVVVLGSTFIGNRARGLEGGGAMVLLSDESVIADSRFQGNVAASNGGALLVAPGASAWLSNCSFRGNAARQQGSDVRVLLGANLTLSNSTLTARSAGVAWDRDAAGACWVGEVFVDGICRRCPPGTFSLDASAASCTACPAHALCPGGDALTPLAGHARAPRLAAAAVLACPRAASCEHGGVCSQGYEGVLCVSCSEHGFGTSSQFTCAACAPHAVTLALLGASLGVLLGLIALSIHLTWLDNTSSDAAAARPGDVLRLLVLFMQWLAVVSAIPLPHAPASLAGVQAAAAWLFASLSGGQLSTLDCLLRSLAPRLPPAVSKQLVFLCMPLLIAAVELLLFVVRWTALLRCRARPWLAWHRAPLVLLTVAFFAYPSWLRGAFAFFACFRIEGADFAPDGLWVHEPSRPCWRDRVHRAWALALGLPCVLLFALAAPLAVWLGLRLHCARLQEPAVRMHYGSLYRNYAAPTYWWEAVVMLQTAALVALSAFNAQLGAYSAVVLTAALLTAWLLLLLWQRPYAFAALQRVHVAGTLVLLVNAYAALAMFAAPPAGGSGSGTDVPPPARAGQEAAAVLAVAADACFVAWCAVHVALLSRRDVGPLLRRLNASLAARGVATPWAAGSGDGQRLPSATALVHGKGPVAAECADASLGR